MDRSQLLEIAKSLVNPMQLSRPDLDAATVGCAILSSQGNIYTGVCIHLSCGIGFCAEHAAVAEMIKGGETQVDTIVAASDTGVLTPCGRCRELLVQVDQDNFNCQVMISETESKQLKELLPDHWLGNSDLDLGY